MRKEIQSSACLGGDVCVERGFIRLIRGLGLDKSMQALVLLGGTKKLEGDPASADRTDDCSHFKRKFTFTERQSQIEDVVEVDMGFTFNDTTAHRKIEHRSLPSNLTPGEGEIEPHGNSEMFASIDRMPRVVDTQVRCQKSMAAEGTKKG